MCGVGVGGGGEVARACPPRARAAASVRHEVTERAVAAAGCAERLGGVGAVREPRGTGRAA